MSDYDFASLNDKEFEIFCVDLLSEVYKNRFERFKPGRDAGIDGRFFADDDKEIVLQCKHWCSTPLKQLIGALGKTEKAKLDKLKPHKYILAVSNAISRNDKKKILVALSPYIKSESDIYGKEDLNDLLRKYPVIEKNHYKLWIHSAGVISNIFNCAIYGRSSFSLEEISRSVSLYALTSNHQQAIQKLEKYRVIIITGEPGVGKTTLANHLCLHYAANGFEYLKIANDVEEAESIFNPDTKQIIYFDDFLGRNYLEALRGHEGSHIAQFIGRIACNKNKRFVLTSRSTILNQGKSLIDIFDHINVKKNEFELLIKNLSKMDKAHILYNHIWHSGLDTSYIEEIYKEKRYKTIIQHRNYNPRLISYITDFTRLEDCPAHEYWSYITYSLEHPSQIWENPFTAQQDDFGRAIIFLTVLNGKPIKEKILGNAYRRYISFSENHNMQGRREFISNIKILTGSFLNRMIEKVSQPIIDIFNPSIADFVLDYYSGNIAALQLALTSLQTVECIVTIRSLVRNGRLSATDAFTIYNFSVTHLNSNNFQGVEVKFLSSLCEAYSRRTSLPAIDSNWNAALNFIVDHHNNSSLETILFNFQWALKNGVINAEQAIILINDNLENILSDEEIDEATSLLALIPKDTPGINEIKKAVNCHVVEMVTDNLDEFIDVTDVFNKVHYGDEDAARDELETLVMSKLDDLGVGYNKSDIIESLDSYDVAYKLEKYLINSYDGEWSQLMAHQVSQSMRSMTYLIEDRN